MLITSFTGGKYIYTPHNNLIVRQSDFSNGGNVSCNMGDVVLPFDEIMLRDFYSGKLDFVNIGLTEQCNLRCSYCVYSGKFPSLRTHSGQTLSIQQVQQILRWFFKKSSQSKNINIGFYGGEVLTCKTLLFHAVKYAEFLFKNRLKSIYITTNGTLISKEFANFLLKHPKIQLSVTLNGTAEIHDKGRRTLANLPTHERIISNILQLREVLGGSFSHRVTFIANYHDILERKNIFDFFHSHPLLSANRVLYTAVESPCTAAEADKTFFQEVEKQFLSGTKCQDLVKQYGVSSDFLSKIHFRTKGISSKTIFPGACSPLLARLFVTTSGDIHFCESTEDMPSCGNVFSGDLEFEQIQHIISLLLDLLNNKLKCSNCPAVNFCSLCHKTFFYQHWIRPLKDIKMQCKSMVDTVIFYLRLYVSIAETEPEYLNSLYPLKLDKDYIQQVEKAIHRQDFCADNNIKIESIKE